MVDASGAGGCVCDPGFAVDPADPFECDCVPECGGRECGPDNCGGDCGPCSDTEFCDDQSVCQPVPDPSSSTSDGTTGDPTGDPTMGTMDSGDGSTTMVDPTGTGTASG
jgi:hypothetical protein